jgi:hypothetical protein
VANNPSTDDEIETTVELGDRDAPFRRRRTLAFLLCSIALAISTVGCSSSTGASSRFSAPVVPGGAALTVKAGSPGICSHLVNMAALREIGSAMAGLATTPPAPEASSQLHGAAREFRSLSLAASGTLRSDLVAVAAAVDLVASQGIGDADPVATASNSLIELGKEVQIQCHFPVT